MSASQSFYRRLRQRWALKRLQWELATSKRLQKECEQGNCFILAELEEKYQMQIKWKIIALACEAGTGCPPEAQEKNNCSVGEGGPGPTQPVQSGHS